MLFTSIYHTLRQSAVFDARFHYLDGTIFKEEIDIHFAHDMRRGVQFMQGLLEIRFEMQYLQSQKYYYVPPIHSYYQQREVAIKGVTKGIWARNS